MSASVLAKHGFRPLPSQIRHASQHDGVLILSSQIRHANKGASLRHGFQAFTNEIRHANKGAFCARLACAYPGQKRYLQTNPLYEGHVPLNWFETALLAVGSAYKSLTDPRRGGVCCIHCHRLIGLFG